MGQKSLVRKPPQKISENSRRWRNNIKKNAPERQVLGCVFYYVAHDNDERWASVIIRSTLIIP
jgi:hypothetical protein